MQYIKPELICRIFAAENIVTASDSENPDGITAVQNVKNALGNTYNDSNTYVVNWSDMSE